MRPVETVLVDKWNGFEDNFAPISNIDVEDTWSSNSTTPNSVYLKRHRIEPTVGLPLILSRTCCNRIVVLFYIAKFHVVTRNHHVYLTFGRSSFSAS